VGGSGSGRRPCSSRGITDDYLRLDIRHLQRVGRLKTGNRIFRWQWKFHNGSAFSISMCLKLDKIILSYRHKVEKDWKEKWYPVGIDWTPYNFGGQKALFLCPSQGCGRRVAILYYSQSVFACRHCCRLDYRCQRENASDRVFRKTNKIRKKLGWKEGILNPMEGKPKGMHWKTFSKLMQQHNRFLRTSLDSMRQQLGLKDED